MSVRISKCVEFEKGNSMNFIKTALKITIGMGIVCGILGGKKCGLKMTACFAGLFLYAGGLFA